jgi:hypothetical protein
MISCYADGELSGNEKSRLERHLEECASCRSLLSLYKGIAAAAEESLTEPPANFTESIMSKIKALPEEEQAHTNLPKGSKKSLRPIIISFVAAAACLTLVLMASPGLFGLTGGKSSSMSVPMASAAPAAYDAAVSEVATDNSMQQATLKAAEEADEGNSVVDGDANAGSPDATAGDAETAPRQELGIAASATPMPEPGTAPEFQATGKGETEELKFYYAVFIIEGQLPDSLISNAMTDNKDGSFNLEISIEAADQLIQDGFTVEMGAPDSVTALVIYTPAA